MDYNEPHDLYRIFEGRTLLYIGISYRWHRRIGQHLRDKPWFPDEPTIKVETHPDRWEALAAERRAIQKEHPLHNDQHNRPAPFVELTPEQIRQNLAAKAALVCAGLLALRWAADATAAWWLNPRTDGTLPKPRNPFTEAPAPVLKQAMDIYLAMAGGVPALPVGTKPDFGNPAADCR